MGIGTEFKQGTEIKTFKLHREANTRKQCTARILTQIGLDMHAAAADLTHTKS